MAKADKKKGMPVRAPRKGRAAPVPGAPLATPTLSLGALVALEGKPERSWWQGPPGLMRALDAEGAAKWDADVRQAEEDRRLGASIRIRETFAAGHEPAWLDVAKTRYRELGTYLTLMSHHADLPDFEVPDDVRATCEKELRAFVASFGTAPATLELRYFLICVDDVARRRSETARALLDGNEKVKGSDAPGALVILYGLINSVIANKLQARHAEMKRLFAKWPDVSPRPPTRWDVLTALWNDVSGRTENGNPLSTQSVRSVWNKGPGKHRKA